MMWSVISRVGQMLGLVSSDPQVDLDAIAAVLDAEDNIPEVEQSNDSVGTDSDGVLCQHRVGIITELYDSHGFIDAGDDSQLYFKRTEGLEHLSVGNRVVYLVFRMSDNDSWIVRKILYVENEFWDNKVVTEDEEAVKQTIREECETAYKHVVAKVTGRQGRTVLAGQLHFCLDSVQVDFIPAEGDWLMLESLVQTEKQEDTLLVVDRVTPVRSRQLEGKVSHWSQETHQGIIDSEVFFSKEACEPGFLPRVNDEVIVYCIESEQGQLTWRAVHVVPTITKSQEVPHDPQILATLLQNKHGIDISEDTNCGMISIGQETQIVIEIRNNSKNLQRLLSVESTSEDSQVYLATPLLTSKVILPHKSLQVILKVKARFVGRSTELVVFKFEGFEIGRQIAMDIQSASLVVSLSTNKSRTTDGTKKEALTAQKLLATRNGFIVPGVRPIKPASFVPVHLGMFIVPEKLINLVLDSQLSSRKEDVIARLMGAHKFLGEPATVQNYIMRWDMLIHLEELEHMVNIARYNTYASMHRVEDYLTLEIPGLAERRPSLIVGDKVIAREAWTDENSWASDCKSVSYEGYIHKVLSNEVLLKFSPTFHDTCSGMYSVSFEANRTKFRREHQAVHVAFRNLSGEWLFPSVVHYQSPQVIITEEEDYVAPETDIAKKPPDDKVTGENIEIENLIHYNDSLTNQIVPNEENKNSDVKDGVYNNIPDAIIKADPLRDVDLQDRIENDCDKILKQEKFNENESFIEYEQKTENIYRYRNGDTSLTSDELITLKKSINDVLNSATQIVDQEESIQYKNCKEVAEKCVKIKVSDMFASKDETQQKVSPPRVPVVARFLQNGNCPSNEKSPKEVKNVLEQLASISNTGTLPTCNSGMKTLEEIEKSLLNDSNSSVLDGIEKLPTNEKVQLSERIETSPFQQFLNSRNGVSDKIENTHDLMSTEKEDNLLNHTVGEEKFMEESKGSTVKNILNEPKSVLNQKEIKIKWNSNIALKIGHEKEAGVKIPKRKMRKIRWINPLLNYYQKEAVRNILRGEARPLPYVIFGPPGTGKTITLVEAIFQIYFLIPESRLLIGTPSNSSADLVCERLLDTGLLAPGDLLRLVGYHYADQGRVPDWLRPYCGNADVKAGDNQESSFKSEGVVNISRHAIGRHRITVGTCNTLGVLYQMGFPRGHFTHVFIDEAGQATEPEILIPLAFLHKSYGQTVLAGDPLQLGPVVLSKFAEHFGFGESLLCRLLLRTPYCRDLAGYPFTGGYNPHLVTRLLYNYRSLPEILSLPNTLFYDDQLIPQVCEESSEEARVLLSLRPVLPPRPDCLPPALVFHGVRGTNCQAPDSPSWHNPHEAVQATMYLQALYSAGLTPDQCGIITPYQAQALKIRQMLETLEVPLPKVGSVEEFQGQERMAIILSTVRSSPRLIETDVRHTVGFVASPRRLNVAITRARAVLIIVGNPHLLARDQYWRSVLAYCVRNGAYTGCDRPALDDQQH